MRHYIRITSRGADGFPRSIAVAMNEAHANGYVFLAVLPDGTVLMELAR